SVAKKAAAVVGEAIGKAANAVLAAPTSALVDGAGAAAEAIAPASRVEPTATTPAATAAAQASEPGARATEAHALTGLPLLPRDRSAEPLRRAARSRPSSPEGAAQAQLAPSAHTGGQPARPHRGEGQQRSQHPHQQRSHQARPHHGE